MQNLSVNVRTKSFQKSRLALDRSRGATPGETKNRLGRHPGSEFAGVFGLPPRRIGHGECAKIIWLSRSRSGSPKPRDPIEFPGPSTGGCPCAPSDARAPVRPGARLPGAPNRLHALYTRNVRATQRVAPGPRGKLSLGVSDRFVTRCFSSVKVCTMERNEIGVSLSL